MHGDPNHTHCKVQIIISYDQAMMKFTRLDERALFSLFPDFMLHPYHPMFITRQECNKSVKETSIMILVRLIFSLDFLKFSDVYLCVFEKVYTPKDQNKSGKR